MAKRILFALLLLFPVVLFAQTIYPVSKNLEIVRISQNVLMPVSYMKTPEFGKVPCNGLIYINGKEAIFIDTPPDDKIAKKLLDWFATTYPGVKIAGVIINHFHKDCLGGLAEFHNRGIKSYANKMTAELAAANGAVVPYNVFADELKMKIGNGRIISRYFGEAHTKDNIVTWIPGEKVLYGGCMVKAMGAGKGNLADANTSEWANTISKVKAEFGGQASVVIPGHGDYGGTELLDNTISMFSVR